MKKAICTIFSLVLVLSSFFVFSVPATSICEKEETFSKENLLTPPTPSPKVFAGPTDGFFFTNAETQEATHVTENSAILNAVVESVQSYYSPKTLNNSLQENMNTYSGFFPDQDVFFKYWDTKNPDVVYSTARTRVSSLLYTKKLSVTITDLTPLTIYEFKVCASNDNINSKILSLRTFADQTIPVKTVENGVEYTIKIDKATDITSTSATLNINLDAKNISNENLTIPKRKITLSCALSYPDNKFKKEYEVLEYPFIIHETLTGLTPDTIYLFSTYLSDVDTPTFGTRGFFYTTLNVTTTPTSTLGTVDPTPSPLHTPSPTPPLVTPLRTLPNIISVACSPASNITTYSATLNAVIYLPSYYKNQTNQASYMAKPLVWFQYWEESNPSNKAALGKSSNYGGYYSETITGLKPNTNYCFSVQSTTSSESIPMKFTTLKEADYIYGDVDGDGEVSSTDYAFVKRYLLGIIYDFPYIKGKVAADVDLDGAITSMDYAIIKRYLIGIITSIPIGIDITPSSTPTVTSASTDHCVTLPTP